MAKHAFSLACLVFSGWFIDVAVAEESRLERVGDQTIVHLYGSPYEMGKAHGELLAKEIQASVVGLEGDRDNAKDQTPATVPDDLREEMRGIADGAKVNVEQIEALNERIGNWSGRGQMGAAFNKRTLGGRLLHVYSLHEGLEEGYRPILFVHHPSEGLPFVRLSNPGLVGALVGANSEGISLSVLRWHGGESNGIPMPLSGRQVLAESKSLVSAVQQASSGPHSLAWTAIVADGKIPSARAIEVSGEQSAEFGPSDSSEPAGIEDAVRRANQPLSPRFGEISSADAGVDSDGFAKQYARIGEFFSGKSPITAIDAIEYMRETIAHDASRTSRHRGTGSDFVETVSGKGLQVIFNSSDMELWVGDASDKKFQGYDLRDLFAGRPVADLVRIDSPDKPIRAESARQSVQTIKPKPRVEEDSIPKMYRVDAKPFKVESAPFAVAGGIVSTMVKIPSPVVTEYKENNTIPAEFFRPRGDGPWPYVIVTHIAGGDFELSRFVARTLASNGIAAVFIKLPYYGERRPAGRRDIKMLAPDVGIASGAMAQAVQDIRRVVDWISVQPDLDGDKIGMCGISLGSITGALATAIEPRITHACLIIGGGSLADLVFESVESEAREYCKQWKESGGTRESLQKVMAPFDAVTYADRLKERVIFMINADQDESVPVKCNKALWEAAGRQRIVWYPCGHYTIVQYLMPALQHTVQFFRAWPDREENK